MKDFFEFIINNYIFILMFIFILLLLGGAIKANYAYSNFETAYKNLQKKRHLKSQALNFANDLNKYMFGNKIIVEVVDKGPAYSMNASYTPAKKTVSLPPQIAYSNSPVDFAIVAHEFGHVEQYFTASETIIKRNKRYVTVKNLGYLNYLLIALMVIFLFIGQYYLLLGCVLLAFTNLIFALSLKLSTVKVEQDASARALIILKKYGIKGEDLKDCEKLLNYAKKTYTADFFASLLAWTGLTHSSKLF